MRNEEKPPNFFYKILRLFTVIHPGEALTVFLLSLNVFLIIGAYSILKPVKKGLILTKYEANQEAYLYAAVAILLIFVIKIFSFLSSKVPRNVLIISVTSFFISNLVLFFILGILNTPLSVLGVVFWVWVSIFGVFVIASFLLGWLPYMMNINASRGIRMKAITEERSRMSREMHDGVSQVLGIIRLKTDLLQQRIRTGNMSQALDEMADIQGLVEEANQETREIIAELRTGKQGFVPTLAQYTSEFTRNYGMRCELHVADGQVNLPLVAELELLRIAREALINASKHSAANKVEVVFESKQDVIEMTISDNGHGFDREEISSGHGLEVMKERAKSIGGDLTIDTRPGGGTEIKVRLALANQQTPADSRIIRQVFTLFGGRKTDNSDQDISSR